MNKFVVRSKTVVELVDIVEAETEEDAKNLVLSQTCETGPLQYVNTEIFVESVECVSDFRDIITQVHPNIPSSYIEKLIQLNVIK